MKLEIGLAGASAMFGLLFQPSESLKALVYFEGGDLDLLSRNDKETLIKAVSHVTSLSHLTVTKNLM